MMSKSWCEAIYKLFKIQLGGLYFYITKILYSFGGFFTLINSSSYTHCFHDSCTNSSILLDS